MSFFWGITTLFSFFLKGHFEGILLNLPCLKFVRIQGSTVNSGFLVYAYLILQLQQLSNNRVGHNFSLTKKPDTEHCHQ